MPALLLARRYLQLLQEGSQHWGLDPAHTNWLCGMQGVEQRGDAYYTAAASGEALAAWPKIRTGSQPKGQQGRRQGQGRQRRGERRPSQPQGAS